MKNIILFSVVISVLFISCASNESSSKKQDAPQSPVISQQISESETQEAVTESIIPHFDDWKYKGFGAEVPAWVEPAISHDLENLINLFSYETGVEVESVLTYGVNLDHAEKRSEKADIEPDWELKETFWVRINKDFEELEEPYVLVQLLVKK